MKYSIKQISNDIPWIVYRPKFPDIYVHFLYRIVDSKKKHCAQNIFIR